MFTWFKDKPPKDFLCLSGLESSALLMNFPSMKAATAARLWKALKSDTMYSTELCKLILVAKEETFRPNAPMALKTRALLFFAKIDSFG